MLPSRADGDTFSSQSLLERAECTAGSIARSPAIGRVERVGLLMPNGEPWLRGLLAVWRLGATAVPLPLPVGFPGPTAYADRLRAIAAEARLDTILVTSATRPGLLGRVSQAVHPTPLIDITECRTRDTVPWSFEPRPAGPALIQYTSGSTSRPKGVALTHENIAAGTEILADTVMPEGSALGSWLPLYHDMGLFCTLTALTHDIPTWLWRPEDAVRRPMAWLSACARTPVSVVPAPDFFYRLLVEAAGNDGIPGELDLTGWRSALVGAEPVRQSTMDAFTRTFTAHGLKPDVLRPGYGLAEATLVVACAGESAPVTTMNVDRVRLWPGERVEPSDSSGPGVRTVVSCGPPVPAMRLRIADVDDRPLPEGTVGEIQITGPSVTGGYLGVPDDRQPFTDDGWLRTGDLAFLHDGELFPTGRAKDLVVLHGRKYYAEDVEHAVAAVPETLGARSAAFAAGEPGNEHLAVLWESSSPDTAYPVCEAIRGALRAELGLDAVEVIAVPPATIAVTSSGKVRRRETRSRHLAAVPRSEKGFDSERRARLGLAISH